MHELDRSVGEACRGSIGEDYEIVLVNDGSKHAILGLIPAPFAADINVVANCHADMGINLGDRIAS